MDTKFFICENNRIFGEDGGRGGGGGGGAGGLQFNSDLAHLGSHLQSHLY